MSRVIGVNTLLTGLCLLEFLDNCDCDCIGTGWEQTAWLLTLEVTWVVL